MTQPTARPDALTRQAELAEHALAAPDPSADVLAGRVADYVSVVRAVRLASPDTRARLTASANDAVAVLDWFDAGAPAVYAGDDDTWRADITGQLAAALRALVASTPVPTVGAETDADRAAEAAHDEWQADRAAQDAALARLAAARRAAHAVLDRYDAAPQADVERQEWRATVGGAALAELRALLAAVESTAIAVLLSAPDDAELPAPDDVLTQRLRDGAQRAEETPGARVRAAFDQTWQFIHGTRPGDWVHVLNLSADQAAGLTVLLVATTGYTPPSSPDTELTPVHTAPGTGHAGWKIPPPPVEAAPAGDVVVNVHEHLVLADAVGRIAAQLGADVAGGIRDALISGEPALAVAALYELAEAQTGEHADGDICVSVNVVTAALRRTAGWMGGPA